MAVAFDTKATTVTTQTTNTSPIANGTLTVGASGTLVIGVFTTAGSTTLSVPTAMTWNSVAMTLVSHIVGSDNLSNVYIYAIVLPTTGTQSCSCTFTGGTVGNTNDLDCFSFKGTDVTSVAVCIPAGNIVTDTSTSSTTQYPSSALSVTTVSGDAICFVSNSASTLMTGANVGTLINIETSNSVNYGSLYNLAVGTTTQGQFNVGVFGAQICEGVAFRIIQSGSGDILHAQTWL